MENRLLSLPSDENEIAAMLQPLTSPPKQFPPHPPPTPPIPPLRNHNQKIPPWIENHSVIRVLLVFANPNGTHPLRLQSEEKCIREALRQGEHGDRVIIDVLAACTIDELARKLMNSNYEIIHFSGHADRTATLLKHIVEILQREYHVDNSCFHYNQVKSNLAATAEALVQKLETELIQGFITEEYSSSQASHVYHGDFTKTISFYDQTLPANPQGPLLQTSTSSKHIDQNFQIPLTIRDLPVKLKEQDDEGKSPEIAPLSITREYSFHELVGIGVGSLAFESENGGVNFMCPLSFAKLVSETCPPLQCVILNACAGHIQAEMLSRVIPLTVCFTGRVSDKESIMFSKGFYESIACGRAIDDAFKDGSRRVEIHSLSNGMPNRNSPGVNHLCNLTHGTPLMALIRNTELMSKVMFPQTELCSGTPFLEKAYQHRLDQLEKENHRLNTENGEMKSLIQYGMNLLKSKDQTVNELKETLSEILLTLKDKQKPTKQSHSALSQHHFPGKSTAKRIEFHRIGGVLNKSQSSQQERIPQKRRNLNYRHVKSSGYGKKAVVSRSQSHRQKQSQSRSPREDLQTSPMNSPSRPAQRPLHSSSSPSRIPMPQNTGNGNRERKESRRKDENEGKKSMSVFEADSAVLFSLPPPSTSLKSRLKSPSQSSQIPLLKSRLPASSSASSSSSSQLIQEASVVINKPTGWSKSYQNHDYDDSLKMAVMQTSETGDKKPTKEVNRSSAGWREFLKEKREIVSQLKPSSSFASSVPRFDSNNSSSIDSLL